MLNDVLSQIPEEDFKFIVANGRRTSKLDGFDFHDATFFSIKFLKQTIPNLIKIGNFDKLIAECFIDRGIGYQTNYVQWLKPNECLSFILWLKDEMESIAKMEEQYLSSEPDPETIQAGVRDLEVFGLTNIIDQLADGDILKWEQVGKIPYNQCFDKLYKTKLENNFQRKLNEIRSKKQRRK